MQNESSVEFKKARLSKQQYALLVSGGAGAALGLGATGAEAQVANPITTMSADITAIGGMVEVLQPIAIATIVFGIGAILVKRIAYS